MNNLLFLEVMMGTLKIWNVITGKCIMSYHAEGIIESVPKIAENDKFIYLYREYERGYNSKGVPSIIKAYNLQTKKKDNNKIISNSRKERSDRQLEDNKDELKESSYEIVPPEPEGSWWTLGTIRDSDGRPLSITLKDVK